MALPWGFIAVGAAGVGVVLIARAKAKAAAGGSSACDAICTAAKAATGLDESLCKDGAAYQACQAANSVWDTISGWVSGPDWAAMDKQNQKLNGAVELALGPLGDRTVKMVGKTTAMHGTVLRFKNGGVPFKGFPGWEKCAPGTNNMLDDGTLLTLDPDSGKFVPMVPANAFTNAVGDPTRGGPFTANHQVTLPALISDGALAGQNAGYGSLVPTGSNTINEAPFPQPLTGGAQGFYAYGQPFTCPAGTKPQWNVRDQRTDKSPPPCVGPNGQGGIQVSPQDALIHAMPGGSTTTSGTVRTHTGGAGGGVTVTQTPGGR